MKIPTTKINFALFIIFCYGASIVTQQVALQATPKPAASPATTQSPVSPSQVDVFEAGKDGYHTYRIPSIIRTAKGTLIAICEGRKNGRGDSGDIDLVMKRSFDNGSTWSRAVEITASVKKRNWSWYATGPGIGIQLKSGRLVIPANHFELGTKIGRSHVIYSDDHGATWKLGGVAGAGTNESQVVERADGSLLLNMRNHREPPQIYVRAIATSTNGGLTWSKTTHDPMLLEPICQASILRYSSTGSGQAGNIILFSNPASLKRERLTVRLSYDGGHTWPVAKLLNPKGSAYSNLVSLPNNQIGCLYEYSDQQPYEKIVFARFSLAWLTDKGEAGPGADMKPVTRTN